MDISVVIPLYNEEESLPELFAWIKRVMEANGFSYEVIFVNDGSTDRSWDVIERLSQESEHVRGIKFRRNYGKSPALYCGFKEVKGDVVITMVPNSPHVRAAVLGKDGVAEGAHEGLDIIDMSSIAPLESKAIAAECEKHGIHMMDAPVSGGDVGAQKGTLTIMCGADEETFEKAKPVLEAIGKRIMRIGGTGMGDAMKIVNNMLLGANMASLAEALVLGAKLGLDNKTMYDVISTSSGNSYVVDAKMKKFIMPDKFEPGFAMDVQYKDLTLAQEAARGVKMPIPMSATCTAVYEQARAAGYGMEDMSAVIKLWEKLMGVEIRGELE